MSARAPTSSGYEAGRYGSGQAVRRVEDPALVAGAGRFTDDVVPAGQLHLVFVRSPYAHARIVSIDAAAAMALPGVLAVYTGEQLAAAGVKSIEVVTPYKRPDGSRMVALPRPALALGRVRFVGEAVAAVVAQSEPAARQAADQLVVDYEELPAVVDALAAMLPGAPALSDAAPDNVCAESRHGDVAATAQAFKSAAVRVSVEVVNQRVAPSPIEPRTVLAEFDSASKRLTMRLSSQMPTGVRNSLAEALGLPLAAIRVVVGDVGGGFAP